MSPYTATLQGGSCFGRLADQSLLTGYEPKSLIEVSKEHTPIILPQKYVHLLQDLGAAALLPPHGADFSLWSERQDNDIHIFDVLSLTAAVYIFIKTDPGELRVLDTLAHLQICKRQSQESSPGASTTTHRRCTQRGQFSKSQVQSFTPRKSSTTSKQLPRQRPGSRSSNGAFLFVKNNNSNSSILRISHLRHHSCSLTVRISLQRPTFETNPSVRIPGSVKLEPPRCAFPSPSGCVWNWLGLVVGVTIAHHLFCGCAQLNIPSQCCACCFPAHIGSVPDTFSSLMSSNSSARAQSYPRHISSHPRLER